MEIDHKPTEDEMAALPLGSYYIFEGRNYIHGYCQTRTQCSIVCPWCYTSYKRSGSPRKNAKRRMHYHGSAENGYHHKISHCFRNPEIDSYYVVVTDSTLLTL